MSNDITKDNASPDPAELSDAALESAAGGVTGADWNDNGIIDGGCTDRPGGLDGNTNTPW